ncbi:MAG: ABC transporter permease [Planctomycetota bacterium]
MIRFLRTLKLALRSLALHPLRSLLTILGILCGVFAVIAMLAIGEGAAYEAQQQIKALGSTNIILKSVQPVENKQAGDANQRSVEYGLKYNDAELIKKTLPNVDIMVQARDYPKELRYETRILNGVVRGTVPWFPSVAKLKMLEGRFFSSLHEREHSNVCVLTPGIARKLFLHKYPIGKIVKVGLDPFTVIGVIQTKVGYKREGNDETDSNFNTIYIPLSASRVFFGEEIVERTSGTSKRERVELHEIQVQVRDIKDVRPVAASIRRVLKHNHDKEDYQVLVPLELLRSAKEQAKLFSIMLGAIAGISLLVGGIGIMNIMLASVTERTREIGIRRALGAQQRHIVLQFLIETVVLSCLGGALGVIVGTLAPKLVTYAFDQTTIVRIEFLLLSFGISAAVGIIFGLYPAIRAAKMDPIEALRHE